MKMQAMLNGRNVEAEIAPDMMLLDFVRSQGMKSVKRGCDTGNCGLCTVWVDDKPVLSCSTPALRVKGKKITTIEGLADEAEAFSSFLAAEGADQCGFCSPGLIMNVLALRKENPHPSMDEIDEYLSGNLCRCTGYQSQRRALAKYFGIVEERK